MGITASQNGSRAARVAVAAIGGYAFTNGYIALVGALLSRLGLATGEAVAFATMTGLLVFLGVVVLAVATKALLRTTALIAVTSAGMIFGAPLLVSS